MKEFNYTCPTNISGISNEKIRAYFSVLYCEITYPVQKGGCQRTGLLSETHPIIGAANLLPFGSVGEELKRRWEEINKETDEAIKRAKNAPLQDRPIIMDNIISALELYKKMQKNMINVTYPKDPAGLNKVKALVNKVMGEWSGFLVWAENTHYCYKNEEKPSLNPEPQQKKQEQANMVTLPEVLNIERVRLVFAGAIEKGWMHPNGRGGYEWIGFGKTGQVQQWVYMCGQIFGYKKGTSGNDGADIPSEELEKLFGIRGFYSRLIKCWKVAKPQKWRKPIDEMIEKVTKST